MLEVPTPRGTTHRVWRWLTTRFGAPKDSSNATETSVSSPVTPTEGPDTAELLELSRKIVRANTKLGLRVEELERKLEAGFSDLRSKLAAQTGGGGNAGSKHDGAPNLLDALDALDRAREAAMALPDRASAESMVTGLQIASERLETLLRHDGITRVFEVESRPPNGRLFRVVGVESRPDVPDGIVLRVVRAAAHRGDRVVREGAVVVNKIERSESLGSRIREEEKDA